MSESWMSLRCPAAGVACVASVLLMLLSGCSSLVEEHARFLDGWRPGRVVQIDFGSAIHVRSSKDCRKEISGKLAAPTRYIVVRYSESPSRYEIRVAPLRRQREIRVGDRVQVNVKDCEVPVVMVESVGRTGVPASSALTEGQPWR